MRYVIALVFNDGSWVEESARDFETEAEALEWFAEEWTPEAIMPKGIKVVLYRAEFVCEILGELP